MPDSLTNSQRTLLGFGASLLPTVLGLTIPGGLVQESVDLNAGSIFLATVPWTASIAAIVWLTSAAEHQPTWDPRAVFAGAVVILAVGAFLAPEFSPEFAVTAEQATQLEYYWLAENKDAVVHGGQVIAHNPKVALGVAVFGFVAFIVGVYAVLYGWALWLAGIVCGGYLGWLVHDATRPKQEQPTG